MSVVEYLWYLSNHNFRIEILVDEDFYGGPAIASDSTEHAALAQEFIGLETLQEQQDFINNLAIPLGNNAYTFCQDTLAGIRSHIDVAITETVTRQTHMPLNMASSNYDRKLKELSALLTVVYGLLNNTSDELGNRQITQVLVANGSRVITLEDEDVYGWGNKTALTANSVRADEMFIGVGTSRLVRNRNPQSREILISSAFIAGIGLNSNFINNMFWSLPHRQQIAFDRRIHNFIMGNWSLAHYCSILNLSHVFITDISDGAGFNQNVRFRMWPSGRTRGAVYAFNEVLESDFSWYCITQNPHVGFEWLVNNQDGSTADAIRNLTRDIEFRLIEWE